MELDFINLYEWRQHSLRAGKTKRTKAEKYFDRLLDSTTTAYKNATMHITQNDFNIVKGLWNQYWLLQEEIEDEANSDAQIQQNLINQQHDILDEMQIVYKKYYEQRNKY